MSDPQFPSFDPSQPPGGGAAGGYYGTPAPGGAYDPARSFGYVPSPREQVPPGWLTNWERSTAMWAYLGPLLVGIAGCVIGCLGLFAWIVPLVLRGNAGKQSPFVRDQTTESLNFEIFWAVLQLVLTGISYVVLFLIWGASSGRALGASSSRGSGAFGSLGIVALFAIVSVVMGLTVLVLRILATVRSNQGVAWRYPVNIRIIKAN